MVCRISNTKGAMTTVNVMGNNIGKQLSKLQEMMKAHPTLVSLCGIADDTTEADLSGLRMDADDAVVLTNELPAKGALMSLNMSNNKLAQGAWNHSKQEFDMDTTGIISFINAGAYPVTQSRILWFCRGDCSCRCHQE